MSVKMVYVLEDGTRLDGERYFDVDDAGGDFRGDAWATFDRVCAEAGLSGKVKLKAVNLEYSQPIEVSVDG